MKKALIHIPHSSTVVPDGSGLQGDISRDILRLTDWHTDELFDVESCDKLVFGVSRFVVDVERFREDEKEVMAGIGMGAVYKRGVDGNVIRPDMSMRESLLAEYYDPHHKALNHWAAESIALGGGRALVIDAHSFPSVPLPCDIHKSKWRPDFCIGITQENSSRKMMGEAVLLLESRGYSVRVNYPYAGTMVPSAFLGDSSVLSIMVEVNRALYMDEATSLKTSEFDETKAAIRELVDLLSNSCGSE